MDDYDLWLLALVGPTVLVLIVGIAYVYAVRRRSSGWVTALGLFALVGLLIVHLYTVAFNSIGFGWVVSNQGLGGYDALTVLRAHATAIGLVEAGCLGMLVMAVTVARRRPPVPTAPPPGE
jgi:hypothetical protein